MRTYGNGHSKEQGHFGVHVISRKMLLDAVQQNRYSEIASGLDTWYRVAKVAKWKSLNEVRQTYPSADGVTVGDQTYTVFNIRGNRFRLVVKIEFRFQTIYIKHVLTHAEYDRNEWKKTTLRKRNK